MNRKKNPVKRIRTRCRADWQPKRINLRLIERSLKIISCPQKCDQFGARRWCRSSDTVSHFLNLFSE
jgi:hypothetical protein